MPQIVDNEDGSKTFSINSSELRVVKELLDEVVPAFRKVLQVVEGPEVRAAWNLVKSVIA